MTTINERIKELRRMENLTQLEFANKLGVTNAHISKIEKGKTVPSESLIKLICKIFYVSEDWLKNGNSEVYLNDIEIEQENNFEKATKQHSKLLKSKNPVLRFKVSQLDIIIQKITNIDLLNDSDSLKYIEMLTDLFESINSTLDFVKEYYFNSQMNLIQNDLDKILDFQINHINETLADFIEYYIDLNKRG